MLTGATLLAGCGERDEVSATHQRPVTMRDEGLKLDLTNDQRFAATERRPSMPMMEAPAGGSPLVPAAVPEGWEEVPANSIRLLNYRFGEKGEVYVSVSRGGVLENVNRWQRQFGAEPLTPEALAELEEVAMPGFSGVWVEAEGEYAAGMGQPPMSDAALFGVVAEGGDGEIFTVKMIGPRDAVAGEKDRLRAFVASLKPES